MNKKIYTRIIEWSDEDNCYLGSLPELSEGHCTHADSIEQLNKNLDEVEALSLEGLSEQPPRGIEIFVPAKNRSWINKNYITNIRESKGLSQRAFAARLGTSLSTLQKWEQGERKPSGASAKLLDIVAKHPELI